MHKKITNSKPSNNITDLQMKSKKQTDLITGMNVQFWKKVPELKMDMLLKDEVNYNLWETEVPALFNKAEKRQESFQIQTSETTAFLTEWFSAAYWQTLVRILFHFI